MCKMIGVMRIMKRTSAMTTSFTKKSMLDRDADVEDAERRAFLPHNTTDNRPVE